MAHDTRLPRLFPDEPDPEGEVSTPPQFELSLGEARTDDGRPFRTRPHTGSPGAWERLNQEEGHAPGSARAYEAPHKAIERASTAKSAVWDRLLSWVHHPDERVPIALLGNPNTPYTQDDKQNVAFALLSRALDDLSESEHAWNPLVDALSASGIWPSSKSIRAAQQEGRLSKNFDVYASGIIRALRPWVSATTDPRELEALLDFKSRLVGGLLSTDGEVIDTQLAKRICERWPRAAAQLTASRHSTEALKLQLMDWAVSAMETRGEDIAYVERRSGRKHDVEHTYAELACDTLTSATHRAPAVPYPRDIVERLINLANLHGRWGMWHKESAYAYFTLAHARDGVTGEDLHAVREMAIGGKWSRRDLARHSRTLPETWLEILASKRARRDPKVRRALRDNPQILRDPRVRDQVRTSRVRGMRDALLESATGSEFRRRFRSMCKRDLPTAIRILRNRHDEVIQFLKSKDLIPLLEAEDSETRTYAITALSEVDARRAEWVQRRQAAGKPIKRSR